MFKCSYKYNEEDNVIGTVYKVQKNSQKLAWFKWLMLVLLAMNIGLLIWDIYDHESIVLDVILLLLVVITTILIFCWPILIKYMARRTFQKQIADKDNILIIMDESTCAVSFFKNNIEVAKEILSWNQLTNYVEDDLRLILMFNLKFVVIRKEFFIGEYDLFKKLIDKNLSDNSKAK